MKHDLPPIPDLPVSLQALLRQVPRGKVTTYGSLAKSLGDGSASRWVGHFMLYHPIARECPCHRVVRADGAVGRYWDGSSARKARRLEREGVVVENEFVDLSRYRFDHFIGPRPLEDLRLAQDAVAGNVILDQPARMPTLVGGVDVSYPTPDQAVGGYALVDWQTGELVWSTTVHHSIRFPYIPGYLAYRELPVLLKLLDSVALAGRMADVFLVDGGGVLHPRGVGLASHLGVAASIPTIGVTKKLTCGTVDIAEMQPMESRDVIHDGTRAGLALRATSGSRRPIFVSVGHRTSLDYAEDVVRGLLRGRRLPEPLHWADRLSRQAGRELADD